MALTMVLGMVPAMASEVTYDGTITIHSPIMGAKYTAYRIFDMTMNAAGDSVSYTISNSSPFYDTVAGYAAVSTNGLKLTATKADPNTFNVTAGDTFDAQKFGQALELALKGKAATADEEAVEPTITNATWYTPAYEKNTDCVTVATSAAISFSDLPLGYYLILSEYPKTISTVTLKVNPADDSEEGWQITKDTTDAQKDAIIAAYVAKVVTDEFVDQYIEDNNFEGSGENGAVTADDKASVKKQLEDSYAADAALKIEQGLNQIAGSEADDNTLTQRLVFIDSTTTHADIIEKNEQHKWDVPVNPEGGADLKPHGEPNGGKNIVIKEQEDNKPAVYADWTEANVGDDVHYQLSINAVNFERTSTNPITVKQIKEYIIADFENKNMTFNADKKLMVTIVKKQADGTVVNVSEPVDYTDWASEFFHNDGKGDLSQTNGKYDSLFGGTKGGLVIPWVTETEEAPEDMTNVTTTVEVLETFKVAPDDAAEGTYVVDEESGVKYLIDKQGNKIHNTKTHYFKSIYDNDVTILVDYYMTLNDTATIDEDGNINISQYGVTFVEPSDYDYDTPEPDEHKKPTEEKEHDDAKVYTYALAIHKVDEEGNDLAGAKFKIKGLTVTKVKDGWYKVKKFNAAATDFDGADELETDSKGFLVIEGLMTSQEVEIMETAAPDGYNKLEGTVTTNPKKIGEEVKTSSTVIYYADEAKTTPTGKVVTETVEQYTDTDQVFKSVKTTTYTYADGEFVIANEEVTLTGTAAPNEIDQTQLQPVEIKVVNNKGAELPSTGGMGTTIFYIGGSVLVLAAAILLITKRRMGTND